MSLVIGNNVSVSIGGTDYTEYILTYSESGGEKIIQKTKCFGNNYLTTVTGRNNYTVDLEFKYDTTLDFDELFESDTPIDIVIELDTTTITYSDAIPINHVFTVKNDDIVMLKISYDITAANANVYNKVIS